MIDSLIFLKWSTLYFDPLTVELVSSWFPARNFDKIEINRQPNMLTGRKAIAPFFYWGQKISETF